MGGRYRDKAGSLGRRYGDVTLGEFRRSYGDRFGSGFGDLQTLSDTLPLLDDHSLALLWRDHDNGRLATPPASYRLRITDAKTWWGRLCRLRPFRAK